MYVTALELVDFRSYEHVQLEIDSGVTMFVGRNGQGKTNIVEALGYLATLGSHRVASEQPLVRHGADHAVVRAAVERDGRRLLLDVEIVPGRSNRARINKSPLPRARELLGVLRTVLFAPEDLSIVRGDPDGRRAFLDQLMMLRTPRLAGVKSDYDRVLKQRNALLKSASHTRGSFDHATLAVWNDHVISYGSELLESRLQLVRDLREPVAEGVCRPRSECRRCGARLPRVVGAERLVGTDERTRRHRRDPARDLGARRSRRTPARGHIGGPTPRRSRAQCSVITRPRGTPRTGSHGRWCLRLRLASFELLRSDGDDPVLILDDVFAELDTTRRHRLAEMVSAPSRCWSPRPWPRTSRVRCLASGLRWTQAR